MTHLGHCPTCGTEIPAERQFDGMIICECGWTSSVKNQAANTKMNDRVCIAIAVFAALLVASFVQVVNWDNHAFSIIPLKSKQIAGVASADELNQIVEICLERKKVNCAEEALMDIYKHDKSQTEALVRLGELQTQAARPVEAVKTYDLYFGLSDIEPSEDAQFNYAKALAATNQTEKAEKYFKKMLKSKRGVLQVTVTRHYIKMLVANEKYKKAKATLEYFRRQGTNTKLFMEREYQEIKKKLNRSVA
jgi:tetratricopeptide (TPR) repeat protein